MVPRKISSDSNVSEIPQLTNPGVKEILYENYYYDVTEWVRKHPGGRVIDYYTQPGEDATIAIQQFHNRNVESVMAMLKCLKRRQASDKELGDISEKHKALTEDFTKLHQDLLKEGMFTPSTPRVIGRLVELVFLCCLGMYFVHSEYMYCRIVGLFCFTMFFGRTAYLDHEVGHSSFTGNTKRDKLIQKIIFGTWNGMSASWWNSAHNRHHAMPQRMHRDIDLETLPLLAFNKKIVREPKQGQTFLIKYQVFLFLLDTFLVTALWKFYLHPRYVIKRRLYSEFAFMASHYYFLYFLGFYDYMILMWFTSMFLFGNFSLSHSHLPVTDEPLHWFEYSLLHTTNINSSSWFCAWWMGYLNLQIEHHLFPTIPNFQLHRVVPRVKALAAKHNIPYKCIPYYRAVIQSFLNLHQVGKELNH